MSTCNILSGGKITKCTTDKWIVNSAKWPTTRLKLIMQYKIYQDGFTLQVMAHLDAMILPLEQILASENDVNNNNNSRLK